MEDSLEDEIYEMLLTPLGPSKKQLRNDAKQLAKLLKKRKLRPKHLRQYGKLLAEQFGAEKPKKLFSKKPPTSSPFFGEGKPPKKGGVKIPKKVINSLKKD